MTLTPQASPHDRAEVQLRSACVGVAPLPARLEPWQVRLLRNPGAVRDAIEQHGSPVNLLDVGPMERNATELRQSAERHGVGLGIYFARKANKALSLVDEAHRLGLGIDLASEQELRQALDRGLPGSELVMTAAIKSASLIELCVATGTTIVVDNADELMLIRRVAWQQSRTAAVAVRIAADLGPERPRTRFGVAVDQVSSLIGPASGPEISGSVTVNGVHFHLDGYAPEDRVSAFGAALGVIGRLREAGHRPLYIDIGGGIPVSYIDSADPWEHFWSEHRRGLLGERSPLTYRAHGLGLFAHHGEILGQPAVYPYFQEQSRGSWLDSVLTGRPAGTGGLSVAELLARHTVQLRCEPGRALVDGCGLTAARVAFRKRQAPGEPWLIGLEMNRTQCRSTSEDFLVDPLLISPDGSREADTGPIEGYLVGAYCIERELLTWRRLRFPNGVHVGDIVVFPNTAGYQMHILESASHQMPLARNLIVDPLRAVTHVDPIDCPADTSPIRAR